MSSVGYARVSTADQDLALQLDALVLLVTLGKAGFGGKWSGRLRH